MTSTAFQITISPQQKRKISDDDKSEDSYESCLILAPFNKCPTLHFDNVKLGTVAVRVLKLVNPSHVSLEVKLLDIPERKCGLLFSADNFTLLPSEKICVNISWAPIEHGSWHHTVKVVTDKKGSYSLRIVCSSAKIQKKKNAYKPLRDHNQSTVISKKVKKPWVSITHTRYEDHVNSRSEQNMASKQNKFKPAQSFNFSSTEVPQFSGVRTPRRDTYVLKNMKNNEGKENVLYEDKFKLPSRVKVPKSGVRLGSTNDLCLSPLHSVLTDDVFKSNTSVSPSFDIKLKNFCFTPDFNLKKHVSHGFNQNCVPPGKRQDFSMCKNTVTTTTTKTTTREWYNGNDSTFSFTKSTKLKEYSFSFASTPRKSGSSCSETFDDSLEVDPSTASVHFDKVVTQRKCSDEVKTPPGFYLTKRDLNTDFNEQPWGEATSADLNFDFESFNVQPMSWPPDLSFQSTPLKNPILKLSPIKHAKMDFSFPLDSKESEIDKGKSKDSYELVEDEMNTTYLLEQKATLSVVDEAMEDEYSVAEKTAEPVIKKEIFDDFNFSFLNHQKSVFSCGETGLQNSSNIFTSKVLSNSPSEKPETNVLGFEVLEETDEETSKTSNKEHKYERNSAAEECKGPPSRSQAIALHFSPPKPTSESKLPTKMRSPVGFKSGPTCKRIANLSLKKPFKSPLKMKRTYEASLKSGVKQALKESTGIHRGHATTENNVAGGVIVVDHKKKVPQKRMKCEDITNMATFIRNAVNTNISVSSLDPFLTWNAYYDQQWVDACERHFIKWLNSLLTPPATLACNSESVTVDIVVLWKQTSKQQKIDLAQSREVVSSLYNTNERLNSLRKAARLLFKSNEVVEVLSKVTAGIEKKVLCIRDDKALLQDIGLKQYILKLLLCYNPLWLRIGLETIYGKNILLSSNSDVQGLTAFLVHNFLEDRYIKQKYNHSKALHMYDTAYVQAMKKFILKKFFSLVYVLDRAKETKLIGHDPCLFNKNAMYKSSRDVLLAFSREFLSAVGDVTKCLRHFGYIVTHEQSYLNEFDYAVTKLLDLRDGIRLCRVMEIILQDETIMSKLRAPALSRLQKIHNVGLAFASLISAGFDIKSNITSRDIVDGHREKTLSLLWQILLKFQLPKYEAAAVKLQRWWRRNLIRTRVKNIRKIKSAITIQQKFRATKLMKYERNIFLMKKAAVVIQKWARKVLPVKQQRRIFIRQRESAIVIQRWWRAILVQQHREVFNKRMVAKVLYIQRWYRSQMHMRKQRTWYQRLLLSVRLVQQRFRANRAMKQQQVAFQLQKAAAIKIQCWIRAVYLMRKERTSFLEQKQSAIVIQLWYRNMCSTKIQQHEYQKLRFTVRLVQQRFRANRAMKKQQVAFQLQRAAACKIQCWIRAVYLMRKVRTLFLEQKRSAIIIQQWYRNVHSTKLQQHEYQKLRFTVRLVQQRFRANRAMKQQQVAFQIQKAAAMKIQCWIRAVHLMRKERISFLEQKRSAIIIQQWYRNMLLTKLQQREYQKLRFTVRLVQQRFRANRAMKQQQVAFQIQKAAAMKIQCWIRAVHLMRKERISFLEQKRSAIIIQQWYRNMLLTKLQQREYQKLRLTVQLVQQRFRANRAMKQQQAAFHLQRAAACKIQCWIRAVYLMRKERTSFLEQKRSAIIIQQWYRNMCSTKLQQHEYQKLKLTVRLVQERFRANRAMKQHKAAFQVQKAAAMKIQCWIRAVHLMRKERTSFLEQKSSAVIIQQWYRNMRSTKLQQQEYQKLRLIVIHIQQKYRATLLMKYDRNIYQRKRWASVIIQRWFRATLNMKRQRDLYLTQRRYVITIQRWFRSVWSKREREAKRKVLVPISQSEIENSAAVKIQALWRGFAARKRLPSNCLSLKNRGVTRNPSQPVQTLRWKYTNYLRCFEQNSLGQMIMLFMSLTSLTELSREICKDFSASEYLPKVFGELKRSNRSFAYQRLCSLGTQLLLNLAKYPENRDNIWQVDEALEIMFQLMTQSVGTQFTIFSNCCKVLWLLADDPLKAQVIHGNPQSINTKRLFNFYYQEQKKINSRRPSSACGGSTSKTSNTSERKWPVSGGCAKKTYSASRRQGPVSGGSVNLNYSASRRLCPASHSSVNKRATNLSQLDNSLNAIKYLLEKLGLL
ncbi:protein abnormal spindle [Schistocerca cancellata]|uniref:protein abnormal spindle n=1 Tax=Schistocerca cancellata TaxID=274614 RepID=UPI002118E844|nr:protein abnormal spindle [Schistocerca cancellata]